MASRRPGALTPSNQAWLAPGSARIDRQCFGHGALRLTRLAGYKPGAPAGSRCPGRSWYLRTRLPAAPGCGRRGRKIVLFGISRAQRNCRLWPLLHHARHDRCQRPVAWDKHRWLHAEERWKRLSEQVCFTGCRASWYYAIG